MKLLIVNADDFGYSPGVNRGIIEAHKNGIVTSTSVMVKAIAAHEAKDLTKYPDLAVGLHFVPDASQSVTEALDEQVQKFNAICGSQPSHIDIHKIQKDDTELRKAVLEYAKEHDIPARYSGKAKFIDSFFGPHANGDVSVTQLKIAIDEATEDVNEIMCHVGYSDEYMRTHSSYNDMREKELRSICNPAIKSYIDSKGLQLTNWLQLS